MKKKIVYIVETSTAQATARGTFNTKQELYEFLKGIYNYFEGCPITIKENNEIVLEGTFDGTVGEYCNE